MGMIGEIHDIAGQHEVIVENLTSIILRDIQLLVQQVKQDRKKVGGCLFTRSSLQLNLSI